MNKPRPQRLLDQVRSAMLPRGATPRPPSRAPDTRFVPGPPPVEPGAEENLRGWGFKDTRFTVRSDGAVVLTGGRYDLSEQVLPDLLPWMARQLSSPLSASDVHVPRAHPVVPPARPIPPELLIALRELLGEENLSQEPEQRLRHGHGHTQQEIWAIRYGRLPRVPDLVCWPTEHAQVLALVELAEAHGLCLIPFGGGTNVTDALRCPVDEERPILSLDMRRMNRILWIDPVNRMAEIQAGAVGRHIHAQLREHGLTIGHEPDSVEFSTLGGWIATHASGMKKNRYGNIEDIVLDITAITPAGVLSREGARPRESVGVQPRTLFFGSEGNLGIITSATVKLFPLPEVQAHDSFLFPDFEAGFAFVQEVGRSGQVPASLRLLDNTQFQFGQALKPRSEGVARLKSRAESLVVTKLKGFDPERLSVATIVYEGGREEVALQQATLKRIAGRHGGMPAGAANGSRGYQLTFAIAYIRDLIFDHWMVAESFETAVPWSRALSLYHRVHDRVRATHAAMGLPGTPFFTGRVTQVYDTGVCIYFYMGFYAKGVEDPSGKYLELENAVRDEILDAGGSLSHHHGVGKLRQAFMDRVMSDGARACNRGIKQVLDPGNILGARNHGVMGAAPVPVDLLPDEVSAAAGVR